MKKLTIITVTFNSDKTIERTILSVMSQEFFSNIEHIVVDGKSNDLTLEIVKNYNVKYVSERDEGIYDAMNKGLGLASSKYIMWLNSDDYLRDKQALNEFFLSDVNFDLYMSSTHIINGEGKVVRKIMAKRPTRFDLFLGWIPPHPSFICKTDLARQIRGYDQSYKISADYGFMIKILRSSTTILVSKRIITIMSLGGITNSSIGNKFKIVRDIWIQQFKAGIYNPLYPLTRLLLKIGQYE